MVTVTASIASRYSSKSTTGVGSSVVEVVVAKAVEMKKTIILVVHLPRYPRGRVSDVELKDHGLAL